MRRIGGGTIATATDQLPSAGCARPPTWRPQRVHWSGCAGSVTWPPVRRHRSAKSVSWPWICSATEENQHEIAAQSNALEIAMPRYSIVTVRLLLR